MNRQQYMAALTEKLQGYPVSFREEVLENFASHFEEGQAMGKSDEEIIRELGPVEEVAEYVRQVTMGEVPEAQPEADGPETAWQEEAPAGQTSGKLYGNIRSLVIESRRGGSVDVRLVPGAELEYRLEPAQDIYHAVSDMIAQINGLFGIRTENRNVPDGAVFERLEADRAVLTVEGTRGVLVVSVPACVKELAVSLTSGDIRVEGLTVEKTALKSVSGDIRLSGFKSASLKADSVSGDVKLEDILADSVQISVMSGDVEMERVTGDAMITAMSGDIDITGHIGSLLSAKAASGDVEVESTAYDVRVETKAGDVDLSLDAVRKLDAVTMAGDIDCRLAGHDYTARLTTSFGDLENGTGLPQIMDGRTMVVGSGAGSVTLASNTGDVTLSGR